MAQKKIGCVQTGIAQREAENVSQKTKKIFLTSVIPKVRDAMKEIQTDQNTLMSSVGNLRDINKELHTIIKQYKLIFRVSASQ